MDSSAVLRAKAIKLCPRCMILFIAPKNEDILKLSESEVREHAQKIIAGISSDIEFHSCDVQTTCPCCFDAFVGESLTTLCSSICAGLDVKGIKESSIFLRVLIPPMLDTARITARTIVTNTNEKTIPFPTMSELTSRILTDELTKKGGLNIISDATVAEIQVTVTGLITHQTEFCEALYPDYHHKKKKKKFGETASVEPFEVTRADADSVLISYKSFSSKQFELLQKSLIDYMGSKKVSALGSKLGSNMVSVEQPNGGSDAGSGSGSEIGPTVCPLSWHTDIAPRPLYLLGRYRKYARDVPQAPWTLDDERKGRNSVEEIVTEAVMKTLIGATCKFHPCGREDIDVRCLGNGRPFILEVSGSFTKATAALMQDIINLVAAQDPNSFNKDGDVELLMLKKSHRSVWENMQTVAEEKRKAYRCVCWSSEPIGPETLQMLESFSTSTGSTDDEGRPCLKLVQKTPLRVLHRRSLLDRVRHVYDIRTVAINQHFFLMDITTSAGTYVKEFVHGDLGRTVPSVCSLLKCQADILQLDVVWLFDDFEGGGEPPAGGAQFSNSRFVPANNVTANSCSVGSGIPLNSIEKKGDQGVSLLQSYSWSDLKNMKTIKQKSREHLMK